MNRLPIVILGHSGFLGGSLVRALTQDSLYSKVVGVSSQELDLTKDSAGISLARLLSQDSVLIVCAGKLKRPTDGFGVLAPNLAIATAVAEAILLTAPKKVLFVSTGSVFGDHQPGYPVETSPLSPTSWYGTAKVCSEQILIEAVRQEPNTQLTIVRPSIVYGAGDKNHYTPSGFLHALLRGEQLTLWGDGSERRDFLFIDDFVSACCALLQCHCAPPVLHVCGGIEASYRDAAEACLKLLQQEGPILRRPRSRPAVDQVMRSCEMDKVQPNSSVPRPLSDGLLLTLRELRSANALGF